MSRIQVEGLTKRFGEVAAVDRVSLDISHGDFLVLLGPSGCGKSTLLRMIAGLIEPSGGRVLLDGRDVTFAPPRERDMAMVFQSYALYPHLTVERNIGFPLRSRRRPRAEIRQKVREVAALLDLAELLDRRPRELSGGQRQRVAVGRALVRDPGAFLMDEPLSNLDAKLRTATRGQLRALHHTLGSTIVYVTHDQVEAMTMATRVALLNAGRLEQVGTPTDVYDEPASVFVAGFLGSPAMNLLPARIESRAGRVQVLAPGVELSLWAADDQPAREVTLGVRPEHLVLIPPASVSSASPASSSISSPPASSPTSLTSKSPVFRGVVETVENLGGEEVAQCAVGDARVLARGPRPLGLRPGEPVAFGVPADRVHLFDRASGRRLVWQPASGDIPRERDHAHDSAAAVAGS
ncbi:MULTISPECIES: ABC transporter ATP-binding protein [Protofrankia]|uniref:Glycerol-3-phosphate-transporting ATPase n=1 Tax=Candidatus Protofrankia datiscae TaxID=2716812 RepID=F8B5U6_9ACTN|nr:MULTISPECIES: ABC transporter ATP-binding protein [Protofrankia]AEH10190.1 Glycerol-3-phosphate-transporting ATPase [Candidatus Protofrankia datiscae]